jgi:hypothetical protein
MEIKDRISNIKTLLKYCPKSTADVEILDSEVALFFANLFNTDERFKHTPYDRVYPKIYLSEQLNRDYKTHGTTICIEYVYDSDRDGDYTVDYYFDDEDIIDTHFYEDLKKCGMIEYSEVPDSIWEIIQGILYTKAVSHINKELSSYKEGVEFWENRLSEFNDKLKLN